MTAEKNMRFRFSTLFDKQHREVTNTWIASLAFLLAVLSLGLGEIHYWSARQATFTIDVESEHGGPLMTGVGLHVGWQRPLPANRSDWL